ncbi:hypothetical protein [Cryobacterium sp. PAMC25264]|uniref:hypothetical protein n=1 Tax=Cryobacterium sp. PAMC25264 TaxID=2861288 RepID=UPI001C6363A2|nr:hypothetical protein [Cryobacterium sp. PAMC25264]QYF75191.1 hypothetical protein KY500_08995 [Cryobacterium sp. PAMC25264]
MKRISYCGDSFLTSDRAADALLELVVTFPGDHDPELLELPAVNSAGSEIVVHVVVGPGSELISVPEETTAGEPDTLETVAYLRRRMHAMSVHRNLSYSEASSFAEYEWDALRQDPPPAAMSAAS